jgi:hypothetical protein
LPTFIHSLFSPEKSQMKSLRLHFLTISNFIVTKVKIFSGWPFLDLGSTGWFKKGILRKIIWMALWPAVQICFFLLGFFG